MFKRITLEVSLKPFKKTDDKYISSVIRKMFVQWMPLLKEREEISVMMWTADGSEILEYNGDNDAAFEWCSYVGTANKPLLSEKENPATSLHERKQKYIENPPVMIYGVLKNIVGKIKQIGKELYPNSKITVGETFDIGPEFAVSDFKYNRHKEITSGQKLDTFGFVDATALLNGDNRRYAAYPEGIPDKTPFATFLGKQANIFLRDMGFDYIWLSNGFGFSDCPWSFEGKVFDGNEFKPDRLYGVKNKIKEFWTLFRKECPDILITTRGTNNSVGIDYATDGVPLYDIYNGGLNIVPPPNSPWAALNDNFGLEIMGHMTRICELPGDEFLFRYYIHDPWWVNSPWYDRYGGEPHDIYLPMAISRIDAAGNVCSAELLNILSVDNSFGDMPDACVNEPLPHILKAEKDAADKPSPLVWVYPMREFTTTTDADTLAEMYYGDRYIMDAINDGFPLNCVVSADNFLKHDLNIYKASILVSPVPQTAEIANKLSEFEQTGGKVIYYGSEEKLSEFPDAPNKVAVTSSPSKIREMLERFGYSIKFNKISNEVKSPCITVSSSDNSMLFSVYNPNLTTETALKFPWGAPILTGTDCEIKDGYSMYRFGRSEHKECRVFVEQEKGIISLKEIAPISVVYHRILRITGLNDATVCIFPEKRGNETLKVSSVLKGDLTPVYYDRFEQILDPAYGIYYRGEHIFGDYTILLPR